MHCTNVNQTLFQLFGQQRKHHAKILVSIVNHGRHQDIVLVDHTLNICRKTVKPRATCALIRHQHQPNHRQVHVETTMDAVFRTKVKFIREGISNSHKLIDDGPILYWTP